MSSVKRPVLWVALLCHLALSLGYLFSVPIFEAPDENGHYEYAAYLAQARQLPLILGTAEQLGRSKFDELILGYHPPAYYAILAGTMWAAGRTDTVASLIKNRDFGSADTHRPGRYLLWLHGYDELPPYSRGIRLLWMLRGWSVLCGLVTIFLIHRLGALALPGNLAVADAAALLVSCLPMWSFMHGVLDNGNLATMLSHAVLWLMCTVLLHERLGLRDGWLLGLFIGGALLAKLTAFVLLTLLAGVYVFAWWRWGAQRTRTVGSALMALTAISLVSGWWVLRNVMLYGDALGAARYYAAAHASLVPAGRHIEWLLGGFLPSIGRSLLGQFGWWTFPPPQWLVRTGEASSILAGMGLLCAWRRSRSRASLEARPLVLGFLGVAALLQFLAALGFNVFVAQPQGRYLFPALGAMAVWFGYGLVALGAPVPLVWRRRLTPVAVLVPPTLAVVVLLGYFRPAFRPQLAPAPPHHASLVTGLTVEPRAPQIDLVAPHDGSVLECAPVLRWSGHVDNADAAETETPLYTVDLYTRDGRILLATYEWLHEEIHTDEWTFPAGLWDVMPVDVEMFWQVRQVPNRALGQSVTQMPASRAARMIRHIAE